MVGARPQFIKAAPVSNALSNAGLDEILLHTGQHFDPLMSDVFFDELDIPRPSYNLEINSLSHGAMTGRMLEEIEAVLLKESPQMVLTYGDTNSTLAGALAATKLHIPVAHVEAGPRCFNRKSPEEINRVLVDHLSTLLFCPTFASMKYLQREGLTEGVHHVGDVMFDATIAAIGRAKIRSRILETLGLEPRTYSVATIHREENTKEPERFARVVTWLERLAKEQVVIMPTHPRTRKIFEARKITPKGVRLVEPLGYLDMTWLIHHAQTIATDSGGLQKEAYYHRVPCVTLMEETEWEESIAAGWNRLWTNETYFPRSAISDYGDGTASQKIARLIALRF